MNFSYLTVAAAKKLLDQKKVSAVELTKYYLTQIEKQPELNSFLTVTADKAVEHAKISDRRRAKGEPLSKLEGIPAAVKDVITTQGVKTTAASKILGDFHPPYQAHVSSALENAGAIILGKTNLDEFAMGASTEYSAFGPTKNPWDKSRVPGGSSGGSAVAVAADQCVFALGTDTGGSIRQPAGWTGTIGLKPTYGRVSRNGVIAMASSLDQVGAFTRSVEDAALLLQVLTEPDAWDSTYAHKPVPDYQEKMKVSVKGLKIGVVKEFLGEGVAAPIQHQIQLAIKQLEHAGAKVVEVSLPLVRFALSAYYILVPAEVSTNLERYDGIKYGYSAIDDVSSLLEVYGKSRDAGFGAEAKRRIILGTFVLSSGYYEAYYLQALKARALIMRQFNQAFAQVDVLVGPTSPTLPFKVGEMANDPLAMYMADVLTVPVNIAGLPGISVPCGMVDGLPVGLQLIANQFEEEKMLRVAYVFEQATEWGKQHPLGIANQESRIKNQGKPNRQHSLP